MMSSDAVGTLALIVFAIVLAVAVYQLTSARQAGHHRPRINDSPVRRHRSPPEWERTTWGDKDV